MSITHAGACREATTPAGLARLSRYSHAAERTMADAILDGPFRETLRANLEQVAGRSYAELVAEYLGLADAAHPRWDDLLRGAVVGSLSENFQLLWAATFNGNENEYGLADYENIVSAFLANLSRGYARQRALVSGHIKVRGGHAIVAGKQLRLASRAHASPPDAGQYLLFDAGWPIAGVEDLLDGLDSVFDSPGLKESRQRQFAP